MEYFYIRYHYVNYCATIFEYGGNDNQEFVCANSFEQACKKICKRHPDWECSNFIDLTIR